MHKNTTAAAGSPVDQRFELYDLRVEVIASTTDRIYSGAQPGDWFELRGEMLHLPPGQGFSIYSLASVLPLLAAKQRETHPNDWMTTDAIVANPDPNCPVKLRIRRIGKRSFNHADTTAVPLDAAMQAATAAIPRTELGGAFEISRIIKGGWHLAGGHGSIDRHAAIRDMAAFVEAGITTFDCADIYTNVEDMIGEFLSTHAQLASAVRVLTKFVPDLAQLGRVDSRSVEAGIDRSLRRLRVDALDLVQFHWWDFTVPGYVEAALALQQLKDRGKLRQIGVTNFGVSQLREIVDAGVPIVSHQVQYSLLDRRVHNGMLEFCAAHDIRLLCYGTVAGGFLSERWLGKTDPGHQLTNRSLIKYKLIIDDFGGWALFQDLLEALAGIAGKHGCDIASIASRFILDAEGVAAVIVGATSTAHLASHNMMAGLVLDADDRATIAAVTSRATGPLGDVFSLERDRSGPHGRIMKYDLGST